VNSLFILVFQSGGILIRSLFVPATLKKFIEFQYRQDRRTFSGFKSSTWSQEICPEFQLGNLLGRSLLVLGHMGI